MYEGQLKARNELVESMKRELLGPGSEPNCRDFEREVISANPEKRYAGVMGSIKRSIKKIV